MKNYIALAVLSACLLLGSCKNKGEAVYSSTADSSAALTGNSKLDENKNIVKAFYEEVLNGQKLDSAGKYVDANIVNHNPSPGQKTGIDGMREHFTSMYHSFPDMHAAMEDLIAEGDEVVARATFSGTMKGDMMGMKATNKSFKASSLNLFRIKNGKITDRWGFDDQMAMMSQLGLMPMHPGDKMSKK